MTVRPSRKLRQAFRQYYRNWRNQAVTKWDKLKDIDNIVACLPKNCTRWEACAGTFWLTWKRPRVQTTHNHKNYWVGKILATLKDGTWIEVRRPV